MSLVEYRSTTVSDNEVTNNFTFDSKTFPLNWMIGRAETSNLYLHMISRFVISKG